MRRTPGVSLRVRFCVVYHYVTELVICTSYLVSYRLCPESLANIKCRKHSVIGAMIVCMLGNALLRRLVRIGVLDEGKMKLDYILGLKVEDFLERRLQTQVFKLGLAKSIHHARVLIRQRHIR